MYFNSLQGFHPTKSPTRRLRSQFFVCSALVLPRLGRTERKLDTEIHNLSFRATIQHVVAGCFHDPFLCPSCSWTETVKESVEHFPFICAGALDGLYSNKQYSTPVWNTLWMSAITIQGDECNAYPWVKKLSRFQRKDEAKTLSSNM